MSKQTQREDARALWRAAKEAVDAFGHLEDIAARLSLRMEVPSAEVLGELKILAQRDERHLLEPKPYIHDGKIVWQFSAWWADRDVGFSYRRPATAEELAQHQQEEAR